MPVEYSALIVSNTLPHLLSLQKPYEISERCFFDNNPLEHWVGDDELQIWKPAIGELDWPAISGKSPTLIAWGEGHRNRISDAWNCILLSDPGFRFNWTAWEVGGEAQLASSLKPERLLNAKRLSSFPQVYPRSLARPVHHEVFREYENHWTRFLSLWKGFDSAGGFGGLPVLVRLAINCHTRGWSADSMGFRIPNFVRAAEALLAIPAGRRSTDEYAKRARSVALDSIIQDDLVTWGEDGVEAGLKALYRHRNECVHGKLPFDALLQKGKSVNGKWRSTNTLRS
jgi:hypothetical protein